MANFSKEIFSFLTDLKNNNDRAWFNDNKSRYESAREEMIQVVEELIEKIRGFDASISGLSAKKCIFRIYRDTRFSANKLPYKVNFGAHIVAKSVKPNERAGYYLHIEPSNCFLAGGAYNPDGKWLRGIRAEIDRDAKVLRDIISTEEFKKYFDGIEGEKLKTSPRDYPKDHPDLDLLNYKSFLAFHEVSYEKLLDEDFIEHAEKVFRALKPFDDFLNRAC